MTDGNKNPFGSGDKRKLQIAQYMAPWRSDNNPHNLATLLETTRDFFCDQAVGETLMYALDAGVPCFHVLVGLRKNGITPNNQNLPLHGRDFAFLDNVDGGQSLLACFGS